MLPARRASPLLLRDRTAPLKPTVGTRQSGVTGGRARIDVQRWYAWRGSSLLITDARGECGTGDPLSGLYFREARHLSVLRFELNGAAPWLCATGSAGQDSLDVVLIHPELTTFGGGGTDVSDDTTSTDGFGIPHRSLDLRLSIRARCDGADATLTIANRSDRYVTLRLAWVLDADFADILEAQAGVREQDADVVSSAAEDGGAAMVRLRYMHPDLPLETRAAIASGGDGWRAEAGPRLEGSVTLQPQGIENVVLRIDAIDREHPLLQKDIDRRMEHLARWREGLTRIDVPRATGVADTLRQAVDDLSALALLDGADDECLSIQAGIPLYPALFGRDALTAGWQAAMLDSGVMLDASLTKLGRLQSDRVDDWHDEEPGRIPFQMRRGPLARLDINPFRAYYADVASPLMFVISLAHLFAWTGRKESI